MSNNDIDYTMAAWESFYDAVDDVKFEDEDAELIYNSIKNKIRIISFGDYLKRYLYVRCEMNKPFEEVEEAEYVQIIKESFADNYTPASFEPSTARVSMLAKNWLTQKTVKRNVVFLLGFGLRMCVEDVNDFLKKALNEYEINPKDPFEVICWYCYKNGLNFLMFERLMSSYQNTCASNVYYTNDGEETVVLSTNMRLIHDNNSLSEYLARLKADDSSSYMMKTSRRIFDLLYEDGKKLIANIYTDSEDGRRTYEVSDITPVDFEHVFCSAIPMDRHGNLTPAKKSALYSQFYGRRFSRQHIFEVLQGDAEVTRFDIITLNFFVFSQKIDEFSNVRKRYSEFLDSTNALLTQCYMGRMYVQNPYESFILMCILSDDPLGTYSDVWELSYKCQE